MKLPIRWCLALACAFPGIGAAASEDLALRFAVVAGARSGVAPDVARVLAGSLMNDYLTSWDPNSDNPELRRLFALRGLSEITRQAARLPAAGSRVGGAAQIDGRLWSVDLDVHPEGESARVAARISRDGELVSAPTVISRLGERAILSVAAEEDPLLFVVVQVDRIAPAASDASAAPPPEAQPELVHRVSPIYPESEKGSGREGIVVVAARIDEAGTVAAARVEKGLAPAFDAAALAAARQWRFEPARRGGRAVAVDFRITIRFLPAGVATD